jgi:glycosyltransferase involved in cell wall biosynthesis
MNQAHICILTTGHLLKDYRIFHRQAACLLQAGYRVSIVAQHDQRDTVDTVEVYPLPASHGRWGRRFANMLRSLMIAPKIRADVYHFHDPELIPVGLVLKLLGRRVIYDVHEDYQQQLLARPLPRVVKWPLSRLWWLFEKSASRLFDHTIAADANIHDKFRRPRVTTIGNYCPRSFGEGIEVATPDGVFRIVYAGGVTADRGIARLIDALDHIQIPSLEFHVAGVCHEPELIRKMAEHPKVTYHGKIGWNDIARYLANGSVGALMLQPVPAYRYCSGEGILKLYEYMAVGLPVLISDFPALSKLIDRLNAGIAVDATSPEAIAGAIDYLYRNPDVRLQMSQAGRNAVRHQCNWESESQRLLAVYREVLSDKPL